MSNQELWQKADIEKTRLKTHLLETYQRKIEELIELAEVTLTELQYQIIEDIKKKKRITKETEKAINSIVDLISTPASSEGVEVLRRARAHLREALYPKYPYDLPIPRRILERFQVYRLCFEYAVEKHVVIWEQWFMKETKHSSKQKIDTIDSFIDKINELRKGPKIKEFE